MENDDCRLPLTRATFGSQAAGSNLIPPQSSERKVRSAFVALSGHGDSFDSISDLCNTVREGVFLEEAVIPYLTVYPEEAEMPLNACKPSLISSRILTELITCDQICTIFSCMGIWEPWTQQMGCADLTPGLS